MEQNETSIVKKESNKAKEEIVGTRKLISATYSGPIPPPEILQGYEKVLPGAAERILSMAEKQAKHRQEMESIKVKSGTRDSLIGEIFALIIGLTTIVSGAVVAIKGQPWPGAVIGTTGLAGLVSVFIYGTRQNQREEKNKSQKG